MWAMNDDTGTLFAPIDINGRTLKNRLAVAPMTRITATKDGRATETMTRYYERFARGGFGTVITEGIYTDQAYSQAYVHQPVMTDGAQANAWKPAFAANHRSLMHLAKRYAAKAKIFANGSLHNIEQAVAALDDGADIVTIGRGALANPDLPKRLSERGTLNEFDPGILGPLADIKEIELVM